MAKQPRSLNGKVAAITGGARGIGHATARAFIREGIRCILLHSYLEFVPDCEHTDRLELCDRINQQLYLPAFHVRCVEREGEPDSFRLVGNYPVYYRDGLFSSHFIRLCRLFSDGMKRVEAEFDPEHQLLQEM